MSVLISALFAEEAEAGVARLQSSSVTSYGEVQESGGFQRSPANLCPEQPLLACCWLQAVVFIPPKITFANNGTCLQGAQCVLGSCSCSYFLYKLRRVPQVCLGSEFELCLCTLTQSIAPGPVCHSVVHLDITLSLLAAGVVIHSLKCIKNGISLNSCDPCSTYKLTLSPLPLSY